VGFLILSIISTVCKNSLTYSSASLIFSRVSLSIVLNLPLDCNCFIEITILYFVNKYFEISDKIIFFFDSSNEKYLIVNLIPLSG